MYWVSFRDCSEGHFGLTLVPKRHSGFTFDIFILGGDQKVVRLFLRLGWCGPKETNPRGGGDAVVEVGAD